MQIVVDDGYIFVLAVVVVSLVASCIASFAIGLLLGRSDRRVAEIRGICSAGLALGLHFRQKVRIKRLDLQAALRRFRPGMLTRAAFSALSGLIHT